MNITVFGATGAIGSLTVDELLARGHTVTAHARNPAKIPARWGERVRVVIGQLSDEDAIAEAISGADVVVSALGPILEKNPRRLPLVEGTGHILESMKAQGVTRYIGHGTPAVLDPQEKPTSQTRVSLLLSRLFLRRAYEELRGMTDLIVASGLDWTIVRFTSPNNKPKTGRLRVGFYGTDPIGFAVSRGDIAAFTAAQVDDRTYVGRAPAISD